MFMIHWSNQMSLMHVTEIYSKRPLTKRLKTAGDSIPPPVTSTRYCEGYFVIMFFPCLHYVGVACVYMILLYFPVTNIKFYGNFYLRFVTLFDFFKFPNGDTFL